MRNFRNVQKVAEWRLCSGCGACYSVCENNNIKLINIIEDGIRPFVDEKNCKNCNKCIKVCPGIKVENTTKKQNQINVNRNFIKWGNMIEIWEGCARDKNIRHIGSSGGVITALTKYGLESGVLVGTVHVGQDKQNPFKNSTYFSTNTESIITNAGSRYSPASPCDSLGKIAESNGPCGLIGKPCDIAGARNVVSIKEEIRKNMAIMIGFFCAGTPSTLGSIELIKEINIEKNKVKSIKYRGHGWPGEFEVDQDSNQNIKGTKTYEESWGFLQKYRPFRCHMCPDGTSELADISCGDAWYKKDEKENEGLSIIIIRTEKGHQFFHNAVKNGYIAANAIEPGILEVAQEKLLQKRQMVGGRIFAMKFLGLPAPKYIGFSLLENWYTLPMKEKIRSVIGTWKRAITRGYYRAAKINNKDKYNKII